MKLLKVVRISNNLASYPLAGKATREYPHLLPYVSDEEALFVIDPDDPDRFWPADEFLLMTDVRTLVVDGRALKND